HRLAGRAWRRVAVGRAGATAARGEQEARRGDGQRPASVRYGIHVVLLSSGAGQDRRSSGAGGRPRRARRLGAAVSHAVAVLTAQRELRGQVVPGAPRHVEGLLVSEPGLGADARHLGAAKAIPTGRVKYRDDRPASRTDVSTRPVTRTRRQRANSEDGTSPPRE